MSSLQYDSFVWDSPYSWDGEFVVTLLESDLAGYLIERVPLVAGRVMPGKVCQDWPAPFITFHREEQEHGHDLSGSAGWAQPNVELRCWSRNYPEAKITAELVRQAMQGFDGFWGNTEVLSVVLEGDADVFEAPADGSDTGHHCIVLRYSILYLESIPTF